MSLVFMRQGCIIIENGKIPVCPECPCDCTPGVIASTTLDPPYTVSTWDLSAYTGVDIGTPGAAWRLIEIGDCNTYASGKIDENGRLVGLPSSFGSEYHYKSYMQVEQGCINPDHSITWPSKC